MISAGRWLFAAALFGAAPSAAMAADLPMPPANAPSPSTYGSPPVPDWIVTVGLEGRMLPAWPGASDTSYTFTAVPLLGLRKAGTPPDYFGPRDSFGFPIVDLGQFKFGPAARLIWQRKSSDYAALNGLANVDYAIQVGAFAEFWPVPWLRLRTELRQGVGGETGVTSDTFLDAIVPMGQFRLSGGPRVTLQSAAAVSPYFSITAAQAAAANLSGLPPLTAYQAGGGLYSYGAGSELAYDFNPQWEAHAFVEYERLAGDAADSPLVTQRGSPDQFTFGLGATYSFTMHPLW